MSTQTFRQLITPVVLTSLLWGCSSGPQVKAPAVIAPIAPPTVVVAPAAPIAAAKSSTELVYEAESLLRQAYRSLPPEQYTHYLASARAYLEAGQYNAAYMVLGNVDDKQADNAQWYQKKLMESELELRFRRPNIASRLADKISPSDIPEQLWPAYHELRASIYSALDQPNASLAERNILSTFTLEPKAKLRNQQAIWALLANTKRPQLERMIKPAPSYLGGWAQLALMDRDREVSVEESYQQWRTLYPQHPASSSLMAQSEIKATLGSSILKRVAVLLPMFGQFSERTKSILNGVVSGYYQAGQDRPLIILDTTNKDINQVYQQAVEQGATAIIGPLLKDQVNALAANPEVNIPVLALNGPSQPHPYFFTLTLSPTEEAEQVAEKAWIDGKRTAIALVPDTPWGERMADAFTTRWQRLGGETLDIRRYSPASYDHSAILKSMLRLDKSELRASHIAQLLGKKPEFTSRRRQDVDFVFLAAFPSQMVTIRPQLEFHQAVSLPVYTTSQAIESEQAKLSPNDLKNVYYCDIPWLSPALSAQKKSIFAKWPGAEGNHPRLFALGLDAVSVLSRLKQLKSDRNNRFAGATGNLYLEKNGYFTRQLLWYRFQRNKIKQLSFSPFVPDTDAIPPPAPLIVQQPLADEKPLSP